MILTKKYRLVWDITTKKVAGNPYYEYPNSKTEFGKRKDGFESDNLMEIESKISSENLIVEEKDVYNY